MTLIDLLPYGFVLLIFLIIIGKNVFHCILDKEFEKDRKRLDMEEKDLEKFRLHSPIWTKEELDKLDIILAQHRKGNINDN